ncbi:CehA/McbA family metallohydrolase [Desertivirga xinjiangensis]|uniref:CehA/McbA family metallohydrolase n=1 Tax=Desertivirga xinjiangensis TaxID=539206 RepID=UPI00210D3B02|nr:CehA/McbA family metallohydrolase [Pedobacter xinjiangensis]
MKIYKSIFCLVVILLSCRFAGYAGEIIRLSKSTIHLAPKGKERDALIGDWLIRNSKVSAVIGNASPDREANQMVSSIQGAVIDFSLRSTNNDQLVVYYPHGARVDVRSADTIIVLKATGTAVSLKAVRFPTPAEPLRTETTYTLKDNESSLIVQTAYTNPTKTPLKVVLYDMLRGENGNKDISSEGKSRMVFMNNKWNNCAYGVITSQGHITTVAPTGKAGLVAQGYRFYYGSGPKDSVSVAGGKTLSIERRLITAEDINGLKEQETGIKWEKVPVLIQDAVQKKLGDVFLDIYNEADELISSAITGPSGKLDLLLSAGTYKLYASKVGHDTIQQTIRVPFTGMLNLKMKQESAVSFHINTKDAMGNTFPVKVEFKGIKGSRNPVLGPPTRANGNSNLYYSKSTDFRVSLPEGSYEAIFSHGPEFNTEVIAFSVTPGKYQTISVNLNRAFSTPGYLIGDLHNHTTNSGDSNADVEDRVINMAAAGVEFAPATEHNRISTYSNEIRKLGLTNFISSSTGIELSGRPGPGSINHQNSFPLRIQEDKRGYGAPVTDKNPFVQMKRLYDYDNGAFKLMQQNHPDISQLYFDRDNDGIADGGFGTEKITDVMEIRETMQGLPSALAGGKRNIRSFQWLQMLNLGYRIYGTANSDNHAVGHATGGLFNYIMTDRDTPAKADSTDLAMQVKKGRVIMSNGPFLEVNINNANPGDDLAAPGGKVAVSVRTLQANWYKINKVVLIVNGKADSAHTFSKKLHPRLFDEASGNFKHSFPLTLREDAHLIVLAYGENEIIGMVTGGNMKRHMPMAISNPIFVDIDANGFKVNKDLLGEPLPLKPERRSGKDADGE